MTVIRIKCEANVQDERSFTSRSLCQCEIHHLNLRPHLARPQPATLTGAMIGVLDPGRVQKGESLWAR